MISLKFTDGLVPVIVQDQESGKVLTLGYMSETAYQQTLQSGYVTFVNRSQQRLWTKGETSGHRLRVREIRVDCDQDALLIQTGLRGRGCCHLGYKSCFYRKITPEGEKIILRREFDPIDALEDAGNV